MSEKTPEEQALSQGWRPESEWKGPKEAWKTAEQFLADGEHIVSRAKQVMEKKLKESQEDFEARLERIERTSRKALEASEAQAKREKDELLAQLNAKKKAAIADNDLEALEVVRDQIADVKAEKVAEPSPEDVQAAQEFRAKHAFWQGKNWKLQNFADGAAGRLQDRGLSPTEFFAELDRQIRETFPEEFGKPKRSNGLESDSPKAESDGDDKSFRDLPKEAKAACDEFIKKGLFKDREAYAKEYFSA